MKITININFQINFSPGLLEYNRASLAGTKTNQNSKILVSKQYSMIKKIKISLLVSKVIH